MYTIQTSTAIVVYTRLVCCECQVYQEHYQQRKKTVERDFRESEALLETLDISDSALKKVGNELCKS